MKRLMFALITFPFVAGAQTDSSQRRWSLELAPAWTRAAAGTSSRAAGRMIGLAFDYQRSLRTAWRLALDGAYFAPGDPCRGGFCDGGAASVIAALSGGLVLAGNRLDAGFYATARAGAYLVDTDMSPKPGGYLGAGFAKPFEGGGAFTLELGVHAYPGGGEHRWMVPVRFGYRWR